MTTDNPRGSYDIIGDVHGYSAELVALLKKMGYQKTRGIWQHNDRKAVFAGDFCCRGPNSRKVISIVREMVLNHTGYAILGNHELNAIAHFTRDKQGFRYREATGSNRKMMTKIKAEYADDPLLLKETLQWLRQLPLYIDFGPIRVVHAYWSSRNMELIDRHMKKGKLSKSLLKKIYTDKTDFGDAVRETTRGIELRLPRDLIVKDDQNIRRTLFRIKWWEPPTGKTFNELSYGNKFNLPHYTVPPELLTPFEVYKAHEPLLFTGHYCLKEGPLIAAPNVVCTDHSISHGVKLAAYRWSGETTAREEHFVFQKRLKNNKK